MLRQHMHFLPKTLDTGEHSSCVRGAIFNGEITEKECENMKSKPLHRDPRTICHVQSEAGG